MPAYDSKRFDPPAPLAYVTLRNPETGAALPDVPTTPTVNLTPIPRRIPRDGGHFMTWGWDGTYQVWIKNARLELINSCYTNHKWDPADPWTYIGESSGTKTFTFPFAATDILITWRNPGFLFDAAMADVDGKKAGYGYTIEGEPSRSWMDTSNVNSLPPEVVTQPCGMVGTAPDKSYTPTGGGVGGMMFRFIGRPYRELQGKNFEEEGGTAYHLTGLTIVAKPVSARDPSDTICPPLK